MSVAAAFTAINALRCTGIDAADHYVIGASYPGSIVRPSLLWGFGTRENLEYESEDYDLRAGVVGVSLTMSIIISRYQGTGQSSDFADLPTWLDRAITMLDGNLLLGDNLSRPMSGNVRKVGILDGYRLRYVGLIVDLSLRVRIEAS